MQTNEVIKLKKLLSTRTAGIRNVTVEFGIICVSVKHAKAAQSVVLDLLMSKAFRSVNATADNINGEAVVHAMI